MPAVASPFDGSAASASPMAGPLPSVRPFGLEGFHPPAPILPSLAVPHFAGEPSVILPDMSWILREILTRIPGPGSTIPQPGPQLAPPQMAPPQPAMAPLPQLDPLTGAAFPLLASGGAMPLEGALDASPVGLMAGLFDDGAAAGGALDFMGNLLPAMAMLA
jgi:hypothetical protein